MKRLWIILVLAFVIRPCDLVASDSEKGVSDLLRKASTFKFSDKDSCIFFLNKALIIAQADNLLASEVIILNELNFSYRINREFKKAISYSKEVYEKAKAIQNEKYEGIGLESIAIGFHRMNELDSAIYYYDETIKYWDLKNKPQFGFISFYSLSQIYNVLYQKKNAVQFKLKAYELSKTEEARPEWRSMALLDLVNFYRTERDFESYSHYLEEALSDLKSIPLDVRSMPMHLRMVLELEPELLMKDSIKRILDIHAERQNWRALELTYQKLGDISYSKQDYRDAIANYKQGLNLGDRNSKEASMGSYYKLYQSYKAVDDNASAIANLEDYLKVRNLLQKERTESKIKDLEIKYESADKERALLAEQIKLEDEKRKNRNLGIIIVLITLASALLYAILVNVKRKRELALASLEVKNIELENLEQENKLVAMYSTLEGQEKERGRLSTDLHDGLGGLLASIKVMFENVEFDRKVDALKYQKTKEMIDYACDEVRRIAHNIMPPFLRSHGLSLSLKNLLANFSISQDISVEDDVHDIGRHEESIEVFLYRIAQELLTNVVKHANASAVEVSLYALDSAIQLIVEDNGIGYHVDKTEKGMGLTSISTRAMFLKGEVEINSSPQGTSVFITIPLI